MTAEQLQQPPPRGRLAPLFFAAGGLALTVQVSLLRELMVCLQGDETAVGLGLAAWLAGIAGGAAGARALARRRPDRWAVSCFALLAAGGPLAITAGRVGRWLLAPPPGELLPLGSAVVLALIVLAPAGCLVGMTFTTLAATARDAGWPAGRGIARLYVLESLGSLAAGLGVTFLVVPLMEPLSGLLLVSVAWLLIGSIAAGGTGLPGRWALTALAIVLAVLAMPPVADRLDRATLEARFRGLAPGIPLRDWADTPYQHLAFGGGVPWHLYAGGQYAGSYPDPAEYESRAHRLACLAAMPRSILLVGGGSHGLLRHLLRHPVEHIDLVEIDRRALEHVRRLLPPEDAAALNDPRVRVVTDDPRRHLARRPEIYDLILVLEPPPVTLLHSRLSTVQFYRLCAARLGPQGALVTQLETAPNVLTGETAALAGSLWGALQQVFPVIHAVPGPDGLLLAGTDPGAVTLDPEVLGRRFAERGIESDLFAPELFAILFPPQRVASHEAALAEAAAAFPPSSDERPVSFLHALALRQQQAGSLLAPLFQRAASSSPPALFLLALAPSLCILAAIGLRRADAHLVSFAAAHAVAVTGACGMAWSLLALFSYQTRAGALYGRIGLLTALFMLGLAVGGLAQARAAELLAGRAASRLARVVAVAFAFALLVPGTLRLLDSPALDRSGLLTLFHGGLLLAAGAVTGSLFPVAAGVLLAAKRGVRETAGSIEAADHAGAAVAALAGGVLFIPVLGLAGSAWLLVALEGVALLGVGLARLKSR
jgi:spermidine synthase